MLQEGVIVIGDSASVAPVVTCLKLPIVISIVNNPCQTVDLHSTRTVHSNFSSQEDAKLEFVITSAKFHHNILCAIFTSHHAFGLIKIFEKYQIPTFGYASPAFLSRAVTRDSIQTLDESLNLAQKDIVVSWDSAASELTGWGDLQEAVAQFHFSCVVKPREKTNPALAIRFGSDVLNVNELQVSVTQIAQKTPDTPIALVVQQRCQGEEFSIVTITNGRQFVHSPPVFLQRHRDRSGPLAGNLGMGGFVLHTHDLPFDGNSLLVNAKAVIEQLVLRVAQTSVVRPGSVCGRFIATGTGLKVISVENGFGLPESYVLLPLADPINWQRAIIDSALQADLRVDDVYLRRAAVTQWVVTAGPLAVATEANVTTFARPLSVSIDSEELAAVMAANAAHNAAHNAAVAEGSAEGSPEETSEAVVMEPLTNIIESISDVDDIDVYVFSPPETPRTSRYEHSVGVTCVGNSLPEAYDKCQQVISQHINEDPEALVCNHIGSPSHLDQFATNWQYCVEHLGDNRLAPVKVGVLASTNCTDLDAILAAIRGNRLNATIVLVVTNKQSAGVVEKCRAQKIPIVILSAVGKSREQFDAEATQAFEQAGAELLLGIGFMRILSEQFCDRWKDRVMNVHPSLLPAFAGGMDLNVHEEVIKAQVRRSGCTVHMIEAQVDAGKMIVQFACDVLPDDTPQTLKAKVQRLEGDALIEAIRLFQLGRHL